MNVKNYKLLIAFLIFAIISLIGYGFLGLNFFINQDQITACSPVQKLGSKYIYISTSENKYKFNVEIAQNKTEREIGLMCRTFLPRDEGMLFIYEKPQYLSFWMKNTIISLDIIYIDTNGIIVDIYKNTTPLNEDITYKSSQEVLYVLELNAGRTSELNIKVGDKITL
jgi:uncharacterized protein